MGRSSDDMAITSLRRPSVCPFVCHSHTGLRIKTAQLSIETHSQ